MSHYYHLRKDSVCDVEGNQYFVYGIDVSNHTGEIILSFPDIFFDIQKAEDFVHLCNESDLELIHLPEIIENILLYPDETV